MKQNLFNNKVKGLLLSDYLSKAGEADINGKHCVWSDSYKLSILPINTSSEIKRYKVSQSKVDEVKKTLSEVSWGALVEITFGDTAEERFKVQDVKVIADYFGDLDIF